MRDNFNSSIVSRPLQDQDIAQKQTYFTQSSYTILLMIILSKKTSEDDEIDKLKLQSINECKTKNLNSKSQKSFEITNTKQSHGSVTNGD